MNKLKVFCFGDSITYGVGDIKRSGFVDDAKAHYSLGTVGYDVVDVYNLGINFNTSLDLSRRINNEIQARLKDDVKVDRQLIFIFIGANDYAQQVDLMTFRINLEYIIESALNYVNKEDIAIFELYENELDREHPIEDYNMVIKDIAKDYQIKFIKNPLTKDNLDIDGIHPNSDAHSILSGTLINYIDSMIKS